PSVLHRLGVVSRLASIPGRALASTQQTMVGAEGFEPSNTGAKVPRLTAGPRPSTSTPTRMPGQDARGNPRALQRGEESGSSYTLPRQGGQTFSVIDSRSCGQDYGRPFAVRPAAAQAITASTVG